MADLLGCKRPIERHAGGLVPDFQWKDGRVSFQARGNSIGGWSNIIDTRFPNHLVYALVEGFVLFLLLQHSDVSEKPIHKAR